MCLIPFVDIHTHSDRPEFETITVRNIYPGEGFAAFTGRNFYSAGLHPWHIKDPEENNRLLVMLEEALEFDHVILVGECGLDKMVNTDFDEQKRVFRAQAFLAEEYKKPLIIHCVKAYNEVVEMHHSMNPEMPWIFHSYNGSPELTRQLAEKGMFFSFGINLSRENSKAAESFRLLPMEKIFFETDEFDGDVEKIAEWGAALKNVSVETLKKAVWNNFCRIEKSTLLRY